MDTAFGVWLEHIFYPGQNQLKKLGETAVMLKQPIHQKCYEGFFSIAVMTGCLNICLNKYLLFFHLRPVTLTLSLFVGLCKDTMTSDRNDFMYSNFVSQ